MTPEEATEFCKGFDSYMAGREGLPNPSQSFLRGWALAVTLRDARNMAWCAILAREDGAS